MRRCNQIVAIILLILSILVINGSGKLVYMVEFSPGAGFFPFWLGICLAVFSLLLLLSNTILKSHETEETPLPDKKALLRIVSILATLLVCILVFDFIGFLLSMMLFITFLLIFVEKYKWYSGIPISLVMVLFIYGIFKIWLGIPLPPGFLR